MAVLHKKISRVARLRLADEARDELSSRSPVLDMAAVDGGSRQTNWTGKKNEESTVDMPKRYTGTRRRHSAAKVDFSFFF